MLLSGIRKPRNDTRTHSEIGIVLIWKWHLGGILHFLLILLQQSLVDSGGGRGKSGSSDEFQSRVANKLSCQPEEWLLEVVIGLGGDVVVLKVLLSVESDCLSLHLSLLNINLVTGEDDGDILADADQITVPVGNVLVGNAGGDVEHDDAALAVDVVSVTKTSKLLLSCGIPDIELDVAQVRAESQRMNLNTKGGNILLLELSSQMTLDERGLSGSSVTDKDKLEGGD
jgi:hypothetical protein